MKTLNKTLLCAAILGSLGLSVQAAEFVTADPMAKTAPVVKATMLKLGQSVSALSNKLAADYAMKTVIDQPQSKKAIAANVANASMLLVDMNDFYGSEAHLSAYLAEAQKQNKLIIFQNTDTDQLNLEAMAFMPKADLVLFESTATVDNITTFGANDSTLTNQHSAAGSINGKSATKAQIDLMVSESAQFTRDAEAFDITNQVINTKAPKLSELYGDDLAQALTTVTAKVADILDPKITRATGGAVGYPCPANAKSEKLCSAFIVTNGVYSHVNGDANINILHHYSGAMFRTDQATTVAISPNGSANPQMQVDSNDKKAYYLKSVQSIITPTSTAGLNLWSREPKNENSSTTVASTSGMTYGITGTVAESGPSMGGSIAYTSTQAVTTTITDWQSATTTNGTNASFLYDLNKYRSAHDWVQTEFWKKSTLKAVPSISKNGLQFSTEGVWVGSKNLTGTFEVDIDTIVKNSQIYFTSNGGFFNDGWSTSGDTWTRTLGTGSHWMNLGWLKSL